MESSLKVMDVWLALFFVFSGYLFPVELFPPGCARVIELAAVPLPDRPAGGADDRARTRAGGAGARSRAQWVWVAAARRRRRRSLWRRGLKRFAAYGG